MGGCWFPYPAVLAFSGSSMVGIEAGGAYGGPVAGDIGRESSSWNPFFGGREKNRSGDGPRGDAAFALRKRYIK